jgi:ketosteroid isomerase-like protein
MAKEHVKKWINAWNSHDLKTILSMYSEDIEFSSPKIKVFFPKTQLTKITNKKDLTAYFTNALKNYPNLQFTLKESIFHGNTCLIEYYVNLDGKTKISVIEKFELQRGLIKKSSAFYGAEEQI